jgi:hypothetical protein
MFFRHGPLSGSLHASRWAHKCRYPPDVIANQKSEKSEGACDANDIGLDATAKDSRQPSAKSFHASLFSGKLTSCRTIRKGSFVVFP